MVWVVLFLVLGVIKWYMVHSFFGVTVIPFFLIIIRDSDISFNCPARIEALFIAFSVSIFSPAKAVDRFSVILSAFVKSLP
jgi:hypothetical protein